LQIALNPRFLSYPLNVVSMVLRLAVISLFGFYIFIISFVTFMT